MLAARASFEVRCSAVQCVYAWYAWRTVRPERYRTASVSLAGHCQSARAPGDLFAPSESDATRRQVFAELGARWGTWAARAVAFGRALAPSMNYTLYVVEANAMSCYALADVMATHADGMRPPARAAPPGLNQNGYFNQDSRVVAVASH